MATNNQNNPTSTDLNPQSLQYLGLSKQPFISEILSEKSFYKLPALEKITESLIHQVQFSELLLIVEGLQGSGKTSLFRQLIQTEIQNIKLLSIQAEATDTLIQIQQKMSLHMQDLGDANHLDDNLKSLQMFDQTPLIIMDNAHVLSDTTLQELFRYQQQLKADHEVSLKLMLFANTGMSETLQKITNIPADHMYVQSIPEYTPKQANEFIMQRLANAGYTGELLFKESDFETLLKKSIGTPVNFMTFAAPAIDKIVSKKINPVTGINIKLVSIALIVLALILVAAYFYFSGQFDTTDKQAVKPETQDVFVSEPATTDELDLSDEPEPQETVSAKPEQLEIISPDDLLEDDLFEHDVENTEELSALSSDETLVIEDQLDTKSTKSVEPPVIAPLAEPAKTVTKPAITIEKPVEQVKPVIKKPEQITQKVNKPQPVITKPKQQKTVKSTTRLHPALQKLNALGTNDATWISQQPASAWTMQLLGARDPVTLLKFVRKHRLGSKVAWYQTMLKGKPYYVLIHGSYPGRDTARASIAKLSPQLRALKPWVKSIKAVQKAIK